jgi:hypothetical protein
MEDVEARNTIYYMDGVYNLSVHLHKNYIYYHFTNKWVH